MSDYDINTPVGFYQEWEDDERFCPDCNCDPCMCDACTECDGSGWIPDEFDYLGDGTRECPSCAGSGFRGYD